MQRTTTDGWEPTKIGIEYFKYNKHSFRIEYPVKTARPLGNKIKPGEPDRWQFVHNDTAEYMESYNALGEVDADITVGQLKINMITATGTETENTLVKQQILTSETNLPSQSLTHQQVKKDRITL